MTPTVAAAGVFLLMLEACGASMRPIPDDVEPVPHDTVALATLADAGALAKPAPSGRSAERPHEARTFPCSDTRHKPLALRQVGPDRWIVDSGVVDVVRSEQKAIVAPEVDAAGHVRGLAIHDVGENSCLGALGFRDGDLLRSINSVPLSSDWSSFPAISASISKDGVAVVRFVRDGRPMTVVFEVKTE